MTDDTPLPFDLPSVRRKKLTVNFAGGNQSSNGGVLLLREAERRHGVEPLSAITGMLSAIDRNHCPQSIGTPVRNRRDPHPRQASQLRRTKIPPRNGTGTHMANLLRSPC
jgi:hypothetical protein